MDDKRPIISTNSLIVTGIIAIVIIVIILSASGILNTTTIAGNSKNPSQMTAEIINYTVDSFGVSGMQIKLQGKNIPDGQKNYFKVVGNLNGTPAKELWYNFPEGSKLSNGMILSLSGLDDLSKYNSFTIYLYDKPLYGPNSTTRPDPIFNITIDNSAYGK